MSHQVNLKDEDEIEERKLLQLQGRHSVADISVSPVGLKRTYLTQPPSTSKADSASEWPALFSFTQLSASLKTDPPENNWLLIDSILFIAYKNISLMFSLTANRTYVLKFTEIRLRRSTVPRRCVLRISKTA